MASGYFQGGDYVELLSAQGKAPAAAWKLQGKISKTFDKGIKGNAFQLDGSSETKMQLPKAASSSLGLAQRFVILQLLVPFTRSFSLEICFSDFQKVRRRFVVASAFRETARTALHVQLPLSAADVPRDQWINLVFDLQALSEIHFPDSGFRSMESVCVGGSCRLKRIFTMKDAPTPSRGLQAVRHADIRDIPRQFVFSATQRGIGGTLPLPTLYFAMESHSSVGVHGAVVTASRGAVRTGTARSTRRSQTAPVKDQAKPLSKGTRTARSARRSIQPRTLMPSATAIETEVDRPSDSARQRLRTPTRVSTTGSKLRQPQSRVGQVVATKQERSLQQSEPPSPVTTDYSRRVIEEQQLRTKMPEDELSRSVSPLQVSKSYEDKKEGMTRSPIASTLIGDSSPPKPPTNSRSGLLSASTDNTSEGKAQSQTLRQSILGEIQQKLTHLEDEDERADQRDRELFLRHTSLHSGEWHLQQPRDEDLDDDEGALLSDDEDDHIQLSSPWRRELEERSVLDPEVKRQSPVKTSGASHYNAYNESIFSFSSLMEPEVTPARKSSSRLFDFDSLLQDVKPLIPSIDKEQSNPRVEKDSATHTELEGRIESSLADVERDADDLELMKLLTAKRSTRQLLPPYRGDGTNLLNEQQLSLPKRSGEGLVKEDRLIGDMPPTGDARISADAAGERDEWVVVEKDTVDVMHDATTTQAHQEWQHVAQDEDSDIDVGDEEHGLSIDLRTSELSASGGRSVHDLEEVGEYESSGGPASPASPRIDSKLESDHDSTKSSQHEDDDDDSSFDFEDLVEGAESSDGRDEDEEKYDQRTAANSTQAKPASASKNRDRTSSSSALRNQVTHEQRSVTPSLPTRLPSVKSPLMHSPRRAESRDKLLQRASREQSPKPTRSVDLSSSFSSRRLQRLLESTDWTAELNAQADTLSSGSPQNPPAARSSDRNQKPTHYRSPASSTHTKRSSVRGSVGGSAQRPSSRPQTPSASSVELVYDPLLRCYYDPVANKYYSLAE